MVRHIEIHNKTAPQVAYHAPNTAKSSSLFTDILNESVQNVNTAGGGHNLITKNPTSETAQGQASQPVLIGRTSTGKPTVSQLLLDNKDFGDRGWEIIFSETNRNKPYTRIPLGTPIYFDPATGELSWSNSSNREILATASPEHQKTIANNTSSPPDITLTATQKGNETADTPLVSIGRIDSSTPTVSHILHDSETFANDKWNILAAAANEGKNFKKIPDGSEIRLNPETREITWSYPPREKEPETLAARAMESTAFAREKLQSISVLPPTEPPDLTEAVQPYLGKPYKEINCYNLLVKGLRDMGLPYFGKDGLRDKLTSMARAKGLPSNAFLNGEGIVKAAGRQILSHSFIKVDDPAKEAEKTFEKMAQVLQKGQILSFSTPTRGHTGIISQHNDQWTFINSGRMDNHVNAPTSPKEVGEEDLLNEVENWFKTANKNSESLMVTLGQLEEDKIRKTFNPEFKISRRM